MIDDNARHDVPRVELISGEPSHASLHASLHAELVVSLQTLDKSVLVIFLLKQSSACTCDLVDTGPVRLVTGAPI